VVSNPPADLKLTPLAGPARTVREWVTNFHLVSVIVDPYANESAWILATADRILSVFRGADCRVSFVVIGGPDEARAFLGPLAREYLVFVDPDASFPKGLGLTHLPALVHLAVDGSVMGAAEGWDPQAWREVIDNLAKVMSWTSPAFPLRGDPAPYPGAPISA